MKRRIIIGSVALGLAAGAIFLAVLSRRAPAPAPPDAFEQLGPVAHAFGRPGGGQAEEAPAGARKRPADALEAALESVAAGRPQELSTHFANQGDVEPFYRHWHGQFPAGSVRVERPDEVDAGGENGHVVPVTIWVAGADGVVGLEGEAAFVTAPDGVRVHHLRLAAMPLKVPSWAEAARLVAEAQPVESVRPTARPPQKLEASFYGVFHLMADKVHYAVDARTGRVEREE